MSDHIQIGAAAPRAQYVASGAQSAFTYPFPIFKPADLEVWLDAVLQSGGYSVSGAGISSGGTVIFTAPPANGVVVTLRRRLIIARTSDLQNDEVIRAKVINDEFDIQTAALQQVADDLALTVRRAPTSSSTADLTLPEPEAGRYLAWNAAGTGLANGTADLETALPAIETAAGHAATAIAKAAEAAASAAQAAAAAASVGNPLHRGQNLADLADTAAARVNLGAAAAAHTHAAAEVADLTAVARDVVGAMIVAAGGSYDDAAGTIALPAAAGAALLDRLAFLEANLAVTVLRDQIDSGWSVLKMVDGVADEFEDQTGIDTAASTNETYDSSGDYYHAPSFTGAIPQGTGAPLGNLTNGGGLAAAFDGVGAQTYAASANISTSVGGLGNVIGKDFGNVVAIYRIVATASTTYPFLAVSGSVAYQVEYSSDNSTWSVAAGGATGGAAGEVLDVSFASQSARYWRLNISGNGSNGVGVAELVFYGVVVDAMTLVSIAFTAEAVPTDARLVVLHQPVDSVTLDTDLIAETSRDGGTTWTAAALANEGAFDASTAILAGTADLSAQPAGTAMKWRLKTLNTTEQRIHGVWMQWR
ncbi:MAG: hypothetical protein HY985_15525 [Magnetospirillum sp.]|nr:hypothetical protein [Magnetospirillum sp.]